MSILSELEPKTVFRYFEEICSIPHGSGNTKQISDYCVTFANERGLSVIQDEKNNVIIFKHGSKGREGEKPVILQGHLDMVCEKEADRVIDFSREGLLLEVENGFVQAKGTTLGGDDGIAVAYILAVLASEELSHPPVEAVLTVDEEIGMLGAAALDTGVLSAKRMLNIDSEEEGTLLVSCAGGVTVTCHLPVVKKTWQSKTTTFLRVKVSGLEGGHSGTEIDKGHANANQVLGRLLNAICRKTDSGFSLVDIRGGLKDNAIPREAQAVICCEDSHIVETIKQVGLEYDGILKNEYHKTEPKMKITVQTVPSHEIVEKTITGFDGYTTQKVVAALRCLPNGVQKMSADMEGLVQTSLNLGILRTNGIGQWDDVTENNAPEERTERTNDMSEEVEMIFSVRSSVQSEKEELVDRLDCLMKALGGTITCMGEYPAWEYREQSALREVMVSCYEKQYGKKPSVEAIHAGVECGLFAGKVPGLDCVSFGPDILDIHTPKERLEIRSVQNVWQFLVSVLKKM